MLLLVLSICCFFCVYFSPLQAKKETNANWFLLLLVLRNKKMISEGLNQPGVPGGP